MNSYRCVEGIWRPAVPVVHREEDYTSDSFERLRQMERVHFWYQGRYRFLSEAVRRHLGLASGRNGKRQTPRARRCGPWTSAAAGAGSSGLQGLWQTGQQSWPWATRARRPCSLRARPCRLQSNFTTWIA